MSDLIVYVDGFNLYHGMKQKFGRRLLWLDLVALAKALRPASHLVTVKYFTAPVLDDPPAAGRQGRYQQALVAQNSGMVTITQGRYQKKSIKCRSCNSSWTHYEEKETDVNIATAIVSDAASGLASSALIISADSDLVPAIKAARAVAPGMFIAAAFPPMRFSAELNKLMPASFHIGTSKLTNSQLPKTVEALTAARTIDRPSGAESV